PGVPNLSLLPSGPLPPNPGDLLGSQRMATLLRDLVGQYDMLVIDSPPALAATDPLVLARQADGVLLVIGAGEARSPLVRQAADSIRQVGGRLLGVVLNKLAGTAGRPYYAYYGSDTPATPPAERTPPGSNGRAAEQGSPTEATVRRA
ncbi:MAG TPA: CpsD/CapB family tyrosine-protein kinase, partial [Chloroflexia bacterium]|nr:CpsD/CapB family tyrosine-protein kinase [Chloroflexia bacterium]